MLSENETVISFVPGSIKNKREQVVRTLGKIVVHDRIKVESDILPRYFNHSSFASLRRQLNYFSFTRIGKGRQKGAVYCNEGVIELDDILRLRRRPASTAPSSSSSSGSTTPTAAGSTLLEEDGVVVATITPSPSSFTRTKKRRSLSDQETLHEPPVKKSRVNSGSHATSTGSSRNAFKLTGASSTSPPKIVSPRTSPLHSSMVSPTSSEGEFHITLDLTVPPPQQPRLSGGGSSAEGDYYNHDVLEDEDVLAGCQALLCFAQGRPFLTV
jgi:hypothetical protein